MSISSGAVVPHRSFATTFGTTFRRALGGFGLAVASADVASAQSAATTLAPSSPTWELRFTSGALVATGEQRDAVKDGQLSAVQLSWLVHPAIAITGTAGWARSRDRLMTNTPKLDVFTGDLGAELRPAQWFTDRKVSLSPFVGAGAGVRSYNYRKLDVDATNNVAGYLAAGGELGMGHVGLRLEVRDYATGFKPLVGAGASDTRNDVMLIAGVRFNRHRTARQ
jgi:hypothetical protein